jgi:hypothetical protein
MSYKLDIKNIIEQTIKQALKQAEKSVDKNPSEKQKESGNYKKGHINILGFDITIENPKGSYRSGVDRDGKEWKIKMNNTYGYFKNSLGYDGDHVDVFLGDNLESNKIFGIDQFISGKFDETKFMLGFDTEAEAKKAYLSNYANDWKGFKYIRETDVETFKKWLYRGKKQRLPFHDYVNLKENKLNEDLGISNEVRNVTKVIVDGILGGTETDFITQYKKNEIYDFIGIYLMVEKLEFIGKLWINCIIHKKEHKEVDSYVSNIEHPTIIDGKLYDRIVSDDDDFPTYMFMRIESDVDDDLSEIVAHEVKHIYDIFLKTKNGGNTQPSKLQKNTFNHSNNPFHSNRSVEEVSEILYFTSKDELGTYTQQSYQELINGKNWKETSLYIMYQNLLKSKDSIKEDDFDWESVRWTIYRDAINGKTPSTEYVKKDVSNKVENGLKSFLKYLGKIRTKYNSLHENKNLSEDRHLYKNSYEKFQDDSSFRWKVTHLLSNMGYLFHGTPSEFDNFDKSKIVGGSRGREGYGAYFTKDAYKIEEYGRNFLIMSTDGMNIVNSSKTFGELGIKTPNDIKVEINRLENKLYDVRNNREYDEITNYIEELKNKSDIFYKDVNKMDREILSNNSDVFNADKTIKDALSFAYYKMSGYGMESISNIFYNIGIDGYIMDNVYVIINFEKLNQNLVKDKSALIDTVIDKEKEGLMESKEQNIIRIKNRGSWLNDFLEKIKKYTDKFEVYYDCSYDKHNKTGQKYGLESKEYPGIGDFKYVMIYTDVSSEDKKKFKYMECDGEYEVVCRSIKTKETLEDIFKKLGQHGNCGHSFNFKIKSISGSKEENIGFDGDGHDHIEVLEDKKENINESTIDADELVQAKEEIVNYLGINMPDDWEQRRIGGGGYGVAYHTLDGYVLKVTTSTSEFGVAQQMMGKNFKHLVNIYKVLDLKRENIPPYEFWKKGFKKAAPYVILEEYLHFDLRYNQFMQKYINDVIFNEKLTYGMKSIAKTNAKLGIIELLNNGVNTNTLISRIEEYPDFSEDEKNVYVDTTQQLHETALEMESIPNLESDSFWGGSNFGFDDNMVIKAFDLEGIDENRLVERDMNFYNDNNSGMDISDFLDTSSEMKVDTAINIINTKLRQPESRYHVIKYLLKNLNKTNMTSSMKMDLRNQVMEDLTNNITKRMIPTMFKDAQKQKEDVDNHLEDLNEENKKLLSHKFQIPKEIFHNLNERFKQVKGKEEFTSKEGYKRLQNIINADGKIGYLWMNRLKNFWEHFEGDDDKDIEAWLNGGTNMKDWVNKALEDAEKAIEMSKKTAGKAGIKNAFIQHHYKNNDKINVNTDAIEFGKIKNGIGEGMVYWHVSDGDASPESDEFGIGCEQPSSIKYIVKEILKNNNIINDNNV